MQKEIFKKCFTSTRKLYVALTESLGEQMKQTYADD